MEVLEMYCDLLLSQLGLIQKKMFDEGLSEAISSLVLVTPMRQADLQKKTFDEGLSEAISSLVLVTPMRQADLQKLEIVCGQFTPRSVRRRKRDCLDQVKLSVHSPVWVL
eukprot:GFUD01123362.1.p2 GENE.GFUD01123362.1~~GFUD01123362.1.p2  ORF type:complete len:110 (+),score=31.02 GFUD01123362.1:157-486(+)